MGSDSHHEDGGGPAGAAAAAGGAGRPGGGRRRRARHVLPRARRSLADAAVARRRQSGLFLAAGHSGGRAQQVDIRLLHQEEVDQPLGHPRNRDAKSADEMMMKMNWVPNKISKNTTLKEDHSWCDVCSRWGEGATSKADHRTDKLPECDTIQGLKIQNLADVMSELTLK